MTTPAPSPSLRSILPSLVVDGLLPFAAYKLLRSSVPGISELMALAISGIFPAARGVLELGRRRRLDFIGIVVLVGIAVSIVALLIGGSPKLLLIRESFVTGALGLLALLSLAWPRPLLFYIGRQFSAGDDPVAAQRFSALWQYREARRTFRLMTLVWAVGWLGEFGLRVLMVLTLSVAQVLVISPFVFNGITVGLIVWTVAYGRRQQRRGEERRAAAERQETGDSGLAPKPPERAR